MTEPYYCETYLPTKTMMLPLMAANYVLRFWPINLMRYEITVKFYVICSNDFINIYHVLYKVGAIEGASDSPSFGFFSYFV